MSIEDIFSKGEEVLAKYKTLDETYYPQDLFKNPAKDPVMLAAYFLRQRLTRTEESYNSLVRTIIKYRVPDDHCEDLRKILDFVSKIEASPNLPKKERGYLKDKYRNSSPGITLKDAKGKDVEEIIEGLSEGVKEVLKKSDYEIERTPLGKYGKR